MAPASVDSPPAPARVVLLERRLAFGFGSAVLVLLLIAAAAVWSLRQFHVTYDAANRTNDVINHLLEVRTDLAEMELAARSYARTGDESRLAEHADASARLAQSLQALERAFAAAPSVSPRADELRALAAASAAQMQTWIDQRRAGDRVPPLEEQPVARFKEIARATTAEKARVLEVRLTRSRQFGGVVVSTIIAGSGLAALLIIVSGMVLRRDLARRRAADAALKASFARIENLYNHAPCGYYSLDAHGTFLEINDTTLAWLGYTREEVVGRMHLTAMLAPEQVHQFPERFAYLQQHGAVHNAEHRWRRKDGSTFAVLLNATAVYDEQGRFVANRATIFDITARKRAEEERDRFFTLARDLLCVADFEGRFTRLNPAWERVFGWSESEMCAEPFLAFIHPEDRERTLAEMAALTAGHECIEHQNRYRCKDGSYRWLLWNAWPVVAERLIYASARDVTAAREADGRIRALNADLAQRAAQLEAANRELESFSYSVSHDLRAPLRHIDGFAHLLSKHAAATLDAESQRFIGIISKAAKQMGTLIDDLLAFSRIGRAPLRLEAVAHNQLLRAVIADGRYEPGEGRKLTWDIGPLPDVQADPAMLRQVWHNLIDNAVKYSSKKPAAHIEVGSQTDETAGEYVFFVRDNGVGFDTAYADKLFGVFQRLHGPSEFEGTGIGLANVRRIVSRHHGRTWAEGRLGEGAVFYFSLPIHSRPSAPPSS